MVQIAWLEIADHTCAGTYAFLYNEWRSESLKMTDGLVNGLARVFGVTSHQRSVLGLELFEQKN